MSDIDHNSPSSSPAVDNSKERPTPPPYPYYYHDDEITLKELLLKLGEFYREVKNNWWLVGLISLIGAGGFLAKNYFEKAEYTTGINFLVNDTSFKTRGADVVSDIEILGNNKVSEIARSGRIVKEALLQNVSIDGKEDLLANHLIEIYELHAAWNLAKDFKFEKQISTIESDEDQNVLNRLHDLTAGNIFRNQSGLMSINYEVKSEIFKMIVKSSNGELSMALMNNIYNTLTQFYIDQAIGQPKETLEKIEPMVDSLALLLDQKERDLAYLSDRNRGLTSGISLLGMDKLKKEKNVIEAEYNVLYKQQRNLQLFLSNQTPRFEVIDKSYSAYKKETSIKKSILLGFVLGAFLSIFFVVFRKIIRDALAG